MHIDRGRSVVIHPSLPDRSPADRSMGGAIEIEIDKGRTSDLSLSDRSPADRSMGSATEIEIDKGRTVDLSLSDRSPADRSMGVTIAKQVQPREARHV